MHATVTKDGEEVFRFYMPDEADKNFVEELTVKYPTAMPYFFTPDHAILLTQDPVNITVKEHVARHTVNEQPAEEIATIEAAVETLRVAEYLTPDLQEQLK